MSRSLIGPILILVLAGLADPVRPVAAVNVPLKCCEHGLVLDDELDKCIEIEDVLYEIGYRQILKELDFPANGTRPKTCFQESNDTSSGENRPLIPANAFATCIEYQNNGSLVYLECRNISRKSTKNQCNSTFTFIQIYGAKMMVFANIVYLFFYSPIFLLYIFIPGLCRRAYDKAVLAFVTTQILISCVIITLGHFILCQKSLSRLAKIFSGLSLMTLTISTVIWLLVICFDVSSKITKFRWAPSVVTKGRGENRKFYVYSLWVFIGTFVPVTISAILQYSPIPEESILKPNFHDMTSLNYRAIVHVAIVPTLVCIASNVLFIYTTVIMINVQKSTSLASENRRKNVKQNYILYLKLYLLMDAPYITGVLGSSFEDLWILKFSRVVQPLLMCYAVIPRKVLLKAFSCKKKQKEIKQDAVRNVA